MSSLPTEKDNQSELYLRSTNAANPSPALHVELKQSWGSGPCRCRLALFALSGKEDPHQGSKNCIEVALLPVEMWASLVQPIAVFKK